MLERATAYVVGRLAQEPADALAGATAYLELAGMTIAGSLMARRALTATSTGAPQAAEAARAESNFFATDVMGRAPGLLRSITAGSRRLAVLR